MAMRRHLVVGEDSIIEQKYLRFAGIGKGKEASSPHDLPSFRAYILSFREKRAFSCRIYKGRLKPALNRTSTMLHQNPGEFLDILPRLKS